MPRRVAPAEPQQEVLELVFGERQAEFRRRLTGRRIDHLSAQAVAGAVDEEVEVLIVHGGPRIRCPQSDDFGSYNLLIRQARMIADPRIGRADLRTSSGLRPENSQAR